MNRRHNYFVNGEDADMRKKRDYNVKLKSFTNMFFKKAEIVAFEPFVLETDGFSFANVRGCDSIVEFNEDRIILKCEKVTVIINGNDLYIDLFSCEETRVTGKISDIGFLN